MRTLGICLALVALSGCLSEGPQPALPAQVPSNAPSLVGEDTGARAFVVNVSDADATIEIVFPKRGEGHAMAFISDGEGYHRVASPHAWTQGLHAVVAEREVSYALQPSGSGGEVHMRFYDFKPIWQNRPLLLVLGNAVGDEEVAFSYWMNGSLALVEQPVEGRASSILRDEWSVSDRVVVEPRLAAAGAYVARDMETAWTTRQGTFVNFVASEYHRIHARYEDATLTDGARTWRSHRAADSLGVAAVQTERDFTPARFMVVDGPGTWNLTVHARASTGPVPDGLLVLDIALPEGPWLREEPWVT